jgi:pyroglutamyl-peptidase
MNDERATRPLLVTGFEPFGSHDRNPSEMIARKLDGTTAGSHRIIGITLPVRAALAPDLLRDAVERFEPIAVLSLGLANGRSGLSIERIGINVLDFPLPDNASAQPIDEPVAPDGPAAYFTTLPARAILETWRLAGIPGYLSDSAGTYLCNQVMYLGLHIASRTGCPSGFIHLPSLPEQVAGAKRMEPSMSLDLMIQGVVLALERIAEVVDAGARQEVVSLPA